jgi:two-component system NtrC family sensor kinase
MAAGESGSGRVQVREGEPKLVAFTPFKVGFRRWSLAVATPATQATAEARRSLTSILLFTAAILLVMVSGAVLLDREASRRIRAAARFNRELEHKVTERTEELQRLYSRVTAMQAHHTRLERVAVAGEMAAIVAHEVRQPLNALSINAQMISRLLRREQRDKAIDVLGTLQKEIERINTLLEEHLLALVRHRPTENRRIDLNGVVTEAIRFIEPEGTRQKVQMVEELGRDVPEVVGDGPKLRQVLLNILLNAIQAMPDGGRVTIRTQLEGEPRGVEGVGEGGEPEGRTGASCAPGKLREGRTGASCATLASVEIQDTGPGIANINGEDVEQIFRPFTTTKEDGTGLGLAICVRLMKEMGGKIRVYSKPGEGARFVVSLRTGQEGWEEESPRA